MLIPLLLLAACSSGGRHYHGFQETLSIEVLPNTSKLFTYRLSMPESMRRPLVQVYESPKEAAQHRRREPLGESAYRQLRADTERAVRVTGYCREGILELDYRLSYEEMWMRGECKEGATEKDRERFAERARLPVPEEE
ncbi:hypothetical protein [Marinimicrobium agarilyticum]|uniref:hypothetical protein n=1 Tax=Marinimicrobium agarilyticum TaxID=306546 RepID=UPI0004073883|nr:hypothetical protein [Marinimicrobium agarilyticum]